MKDMLTDKDIERIGIEVGRVIEDNVNPRFLAIENRLTGVEARMVTKEYLDEKLGRVDGKMNMLVHI